MTELPINERKTGFRKSLGIAIAAEVILLVILLCLSLCSVKKPANYSRTFTSDDILASDTSGEETETADAIVSLSGEESRKTGYFALEAGSYILSAEYTCHVDSNYIVVMCPSLDEDNVFLDRWVKPNPNGTTHTIGFTLPSGADDLYIGFISKEDTGFTVKTITITSNDTVAPVAARIVSTIILWVLLSVAADILLYLSIRHPERKKHYLLLLISAFLMSIPLLVPTSYLYTNNDIEFHIMRIYGIRDGLLQGIPWVKYQTGWYNGYGYMVSAFYGDILLYIPALGNISGLPMDLSYRMFVILVDLITLFSAYYCFSGIFGRKAGVTGSIVYSFLFYRFVDMYERGAVGEYCAIAFLPFLAYAVYALFKDDHFHSVILFIIGFTGVLNSHLLSTEMAVFLLILVFLLYFREALVWKRLKILLLAAIAVLIVNLGFIVPFLDEALHEHVKVMDAARNTFSLNERGITISNLITENIGAVPCILLLLFALFHLLYRLTGKNIQKEKNPGTIRLIKYIALTAVSLLLCSSLFPWDTVSGLPGLRNIITSIQFPWRFLAFAGLFGTMAVCEIVRDDNTCNNGTFRKYAPILTAAVFMISGTAYSCIHYAQTEKVNYNAEANLRPAWCSEHEYILTGTDVFDTPDDYIASDGLTVSDYVKEGDRISFHYTSDQENTITLPLFHYRHFRATLENETATSVLKTGNGRNNRICLTLPASSDATVNVRFQYPWYWTASCIISMLSVLLLIGYAVYRRKDSVSHTVDRSRNTSAT